MTQLRLLQARRDLRRACRLAEGDRLTEAVTLASQATDSFTRLSAKSPRYLPELVAALVTMSDLRLARSDLGAALVTQDELVTAVEALAGLGGSRAEEGDRLADALTRRGDTLRLLARFDLAEADLLRALDCAESPITRAGVRNALGILAKDTRRYDDAARHYQEALDTLHQVLGIDHPDLASLFHNLAGLEHAQGRYASGEPSALRALALREKEADADSVEVAADLAVLGALLAGQGRLDEAEPIFHRTLAIWTRHRGPNHYEVAVALQSLGAIHGSRGQVQAAADEYRRALDIKLGVLGSGHPEVTSLASDLAVLEQR